MLFFFCIRQIGFFYRFVSIIRNFSHKTPLTIHNWHIFSIFIFYKNRRNAILSRYTKIVRPKSWRSMHHTSTVFCRYKITNNNSKCSRFGLNIRHELFVFNAFQENPFELRNYRPRNNFIAILIRCKITLFPFFIEILTHQISRQNHIYRFESIRVSGFYQHIINIFSNRQSGIGRECPRRGCPR